MGLAASQARLLTITARKSDCEYKSMLLSHQKIALSRDMSRLSAEYDDAIAQTKLVYDYYGNSEATPLTYNLMMTPSAMNNYTPLLVTDNSGRVVLQEMQVFRRKGLMVCHQAICVMRLLILLLRQVISVRIPLTILKRQLTTRQQVLDLPILLILIQLNVICQN